MREKFRGVIIFREGGLFFGFRIRNFLICAIDDNKYGILFQKVMDRNVRYQRLPIEEERLHEMLLPPPDPENQSGSSSSTEAGSALPPPYEAEAGALAEPAPIAGDVPKYDPHMPPSYTVATELPTYDQVQQLKLEESTQVQENVVLDPEALERGDALLGTDFMFLCAFFVSFLFNWVGFLLLMCFCNTIAGRYGALAGFGLSLAKWTLIVKHSTDLISTDNNWLWWLILAFGVLICVRAVLQYLHVKREWHLLTRATQQRLMYFY